MQEIQKENELNIYQKLAKVRKSVEVLQKNAKGFNYKYVSEDEILAKVTVLMDKYGLSLIPNIKEGTVVVSPLNYKKTESTKKGEIYEKNINEVLVSADMFFTWVNNDKPDEYIKVPWILVGQQGDASQSFGAGLTYSMRYFLLKFFNVATSENDPDELRSKQKATITAEDKTIADEIISNLDSEVRDYIQKNPEKSSDVKTFMNQYVKNGNYFNIKESLVASKLLGDFRKTFSEIKEEKGGK